MATLGLYVPNLCLGSILGSKIFHIVTFHFHTPPRLNATKRYLQYVGHPDSSNLLHDSWISNR